jgi:hypothetical protein
MIAHNLDTDLGATYPCDLERVRGGRCVDLSRLTFEDGARVPGWQFLFR